MRARKILLFLFFLGFGAVVETAWVVRNRLDLGPAGCRVLGGKFYGPSFTFDEETRREVAPNTSVEVENSFGGVRMVMGAPGEVRINLRKVIFLPTEERAREFASRIRLQAITSGSSLRILTNREEIGIRNTNVGFETHLEIALPLGTAVKARNEHGRLEVADVARADLSNSYEPLRVERVAGDAQLTARHGDVQASFIEGALSLNARHGEVEVRDVKGDSVIEVVHGNLSLARTGKVGVILRHGDLSADTIGGDFELQGQHAAVQADRVAGRCEVETSYDDVRLTNVGGDVRVKSQHGEIHAADVKGALRAEASFDDVTLENIGGPVEVKVEHGGVRAQGLESGARVNAAGDDVLIEGFQGAVEVEVQRAGVHLIPGGALVAPVTVSTTRGGIRLEVPSGSRFELEASTSRGEVEVDVPGLIMTQSSRDYVTGRLGSGGKLVKLVAQGGDVTVGTRAAAASKEP